MRSSTHRITGTHTHNMILKYIICHRIVTIAFQTNLGMKLFYKLFHRVSVFISFQISCKWKIVKNEIKMFVMQSELKELSIKLIEFHGVTRLC